MHFGPRLPAQVLFLLLLTSAFAFTGCSSGLTPASSATPAESSIGEIKGTAFGGRQPIVGAHIFLFAAGTSGYGGTGTSYTASSNNASTSLLTAQIDTLKDITMGSPTLNDYYVTTGSDGSFSISGDYTCTPGTQVYIYASGGNPGGGVNSAATLMALLGNCPAATSLAAQVPFVDINELSTVAAAYSIAGFAADPLHISSSGTALAQTGIKNAFANSAQMYRIDGSNGTIPGGGSALANTPGNGTNSGTGTVPQAELNTLANIFAACISSSGPSSPACTGLFGYATLDGTSTGTKPTDVATAAINIAHFPTGSVNVTGFYNLQPATANPYSTNLGAKPSDWTVQLVFTSSTLASTSTGGTPTPRSVAIDGSGNIWIANVNQGNTNGLLGFSPAGVPLNAGGYNVHSYYRTNVVIDAASANIWVTSRYGSDVVRFNIAGSGYTTFTATGSNSPESNDAQFDGSGNLWLADRNNNSLIEFNSSGTQLATDTGNSLNAPFTVALEPGTAGNVWVTNYSGPLSSAFTNANAAYTTATAASEYAFIGNAIDASGNIWTTSDGSGGAVKAPSTGGTGTFYSTGGGSTDGIGMDGASNVWLADRSRARIFALSNAGALLTASAGITVPTYGGNGNNPNSLAVDGSGNVWFTSFNQPTLIEILGAAAPVVTPLAYGVANSMLGTRP